jgi:hypothetical protein
MGARLIYVGTHFARVRRATPYVAAHERVIAAMARLPNSCAIRSTGLFFINVPVWLARIGTALVAPLHPRIAQFGRFACGLARHDVIADAVGTRRLDAYLSAMLR